MPESLRIGLIGCGSQGRGNLATRLATIGQADLIACADVDEVLARKAMEECGFDRPYLDFERMLDQEELAGVVVATPHDLLKDAAIAAIDSGCHVFIEKPMGLNQEEGREIVEAARQAGVSVMVGYCQRFAESRRFMKTLIEKGAIGDPVHVNGTKCISPYAGWMSDPKRGGGPLRLQGVHITDQVLWMLGNRAERVYAEILWNAESGVDQSSAYTIRFDDGVLASILCSQSTGDIDVLEVTGTAGRVRADWIGGTVEVRSEALEEYRQPTTKRFEAGLSVAMLGDEMQAWVSSVADKRDPPITGEDGLRVLEIIDGVFESNKTAMPVWL